MKEGTDKKFFKREKEGQSICFVWQVPNESLMTWWASLRRCVRIEVERGPRRWKRGRERDAIWVWHTSMEPQCHSCENILCPFPFVTCPSTLFQLAPKHQPEPSVHKASPCLCCCLILLLTIRFATHKIKRDFSFLFYVKTFYLNLNVFVCFECVS